MQGHCERFSPMWGNPDCGIREIFACGIRNPTITIGIRNPTKIWNPESKFQWQSQESGAWNPKSTVWNPESKNVLDSLTWGGRFFRQGYSLVKGALSQVLLSHAYIQFPFFFFWNRCIIHHPRFHALLYNYLLERSRVITSSTKGLNILNRNSRVILDQNSTFNEKK